MYAAEAGNLRNVILLVKAGSNIEQQRRDGCTALQLAACLGHNSVVSYLLEIGMYVCGYVYIHMCICEISLILCHEWIYVYIYV
jgi:ankyrin repeat protein